MVKIAGRSDKGRARRINEDAYCIMEGGGKAQEQPEDAGPVIPEMVAGKSAAAGGKKKGKGAKATAKTDAKSKVASAQKNAPRHILAVADGMGGHRAGDVASRMAIDAIRSAFNGKPLEAKSGDAVSKRLLAVIQQANDAIYKKSLSGPEFEGMGTTLVLAALSGSEIVIAHVGDSCAYHFRGHSLRKVTVDHTFVEELVQSGTLTREEARVHPQRNYITKAVGCQDTVEADVYRVKLRPSDRVVLCTDGLSKMLSDDEILDAVYQSDDPGEICDALIEQSNRQGGLDNITALVLLYTS